MKSYGLTILLLFTLLIPLNGRDIVLNNGTLYKDIAITKITPVGIEFIGDDGPTFVPFKNVSTALQKEFGYDKAKEAKFLSAKKRKLEKHKKKLAKIKEANRKKLEIALAKKNEHRKKENERQRRLRKEVLLNGTIVVDDSNHVSLATENYILSGNYVYSLNKTVSSVPGRLASLQLAIDKNKSEIILKKAKISTLQFEISTNIKSLATILSTVCNTLPATYANYMYNKNSPCNTPRFVVTETTMSLNKNQKLRKECEIDRRLLRSLLEDKRDTIALLKSETRTHRSTISSLENDIKTLQQTTYELETLKISIINEETLLHAKQQRFLNKNRITPVQSTKIASATLTQKLQKLKALNNQGLISKTIYDQKVSSLIGQNL